MNKHNSEHLWRNYLFLTQEMSKFLDRQEVELFLEIMSQRESLQMQIEQAPNDGFSQSTSGKQCYKAIFLLEQSIKTKLACFINLSKRQNQISNAYEGLASSFVGKRMDRQS
ncbi:hypothetical protein [Dendrosporobacter sp. 1207_IL3150]|uniref:hypothetical protein n=1 Tax=Dendrosporobacter sp. 1207_IL3150 TaxID=3084054 RepID=UPI002FD89B56